MSALDFAVRARRAFPADLVEAVDRALAVAGEVQHEPSRQGIGPEPIVVGDSTVDIPYRLNLDEPMAGVAERLDDNARLVLSSLYTRDADGRVRERWLTPLLGSPEQWVVPFVIQLLGEYVIEIAERIGERLPDLDADAYQRFAAENPGFLDLTCQRAMCYWACYYRFGRPLAEYPSYIVLRRLGIWSPHVGKRRLG